MLKTSTDASVVCARRWRSGTVAKREIRKLSKTTNCLFPKRPFERLVREIAQDYKDIRFTKESMKAIQEALENFVTEMFHKADMARKHGCRETLDERDVRFARFMTPESLWVMSDRIWEKEIFAAPTPASLSSSDKKKAGKNEKKGESSSGAAAAGEASASKAKNEKGKPEKRKKDSGGDATQQQSPAVDVGDEQKGRSKKAKKAAAPATPAATKEALDDDESGSDDDDESISASESEEENAAGPAPAPPAAAATGQ